MFIPDKPEMRSFFVPYFEDATGSEVAGKHTRKSQKALKEEIVVLISKLGGSAVVFTPGKYFGTPMRHGFRIEFNVSGIPARIDAAALPIRVETLTKIDRALAQCLYLVRDWMQSELNSLMYRPNVFPLIAFLVGAGGKTVTETLMESRMLPDFDKYIALNIGGGE